MGWHAVDAHLVEPHEGRAVVDRPSQSVEDAPEELLAYAHRQRAAGVLDESTDAETRRVAVGKARHAITAQSDDLREDRRLPVAQQQASVTDGEPDTGHLDGHADHPYDVPVALRSGRRDDAVFDGGEELGHGFPIAAVENPAHGASDASILASTMAAPTSRTQPPTPTAGSATIVMPSRPKGVASSAATSSGLSRTTAPSLSGDSARARWTASSPGDEDSLSSRGQDRLGDLEGELGGGVLETVPLDLEHLARLCGGELEGRERRGLLGPGAARVAAPTSACASRSPAAYPAARPSRSLRSCSVSRA